jgi:hypothetical protein
MYEILKLREELNLALYEMIDAESLTKAQKAEKRVRRARVELIAAYWDYFDALRRGANFYMDRMF